MPCGKRSISPRGPDLAKDQRRHDFYHPLRGTVLFVLCFVIYFSGLFSVLCLSDILDATNEILWGIIIGFKKAYTSFNSLGLPLAQKGHMHV